MLRKVPNPRLLVLAVTLSCLGCDERDADLRRWQQNQVEQLQRQAQENSAASRALVAADADSRRQFVALEQSLHDERRELQARHAALEAERQAIALARERLPLLANLLEGTATVTLGILALAICLKLLGGFGNETSSAALEEALILSAVGEAGLLPPSEPCLPEPPARGSLESRQHELPAAS